MKGTPGFTEGADEGQIDFCIGHRIDVRRPMIVDLLLQLDETVNLVLHRDGRIFGEVMESRLSFAAFDIGDVLFGERNPD
jgi:hypothetical protein